MKYQGIVVDFRHKATNTEIDSFVGDLSHQSNQNYGTFRKRLLKNGKIKVFEEMLTQIVREAMN